MAETDHEKEVRLAQEAADKQAADEAAAAAAEATKTRYYKSTIAALTLHLPAGQPVRFTPYYERINGDDTKVGYLESNDPQVLAVAEQDPNIEEISKKEYAENTVALNSKGEQTNKARLATF